MLNKLSVLLFAALVSLAVYAAGTANLVLSFGPTGAAPDPLNLTNHTIGTNSGMQASFSLENNFTSSCGFTCSGMAENLANGTWTAYNDEWLTNWQASTYPDCVGAAYEMRWRTISGTLDLPPTDSAFTPLPEETWSFNEWASALSLCDTGVGWSGGLFRGPLMGQFDVSANAVIEVDIRSIDMTEGPVTGQITFNP